MSQKKFINLKKKKFIKYINFAKTQILVTYQKPFLKTCILIQNIQIYAFIEKYAAKSGKICIYKKIIFKIKYFILHRKNS